MIALIAAILWSMLGSLSVVDPSFPPNAILGGTVIAELHFAVGHVSEITILSGDQPFADSCRSAFEKWSTDAKGDADELVIVHFRQPYLYYIGDNKEEFNPASTSRSLPYPIYIIQPSYPPNALAQGSVTLRLNVSEEGEVSDVQVVEGMGGLTDASIEAAREWKFAPAKNSQGKPTPSHAYAVFVYRFPLVAQ